MKLLEKIIDKIFSFMFPGKSKTAVNSILILSNDKIPNQENPFFIFQWVKFTLMTKTVTENLSKNLSLHVALV